MTPVTKRLYLTLASCGVDIRRLVLGLLGSPQYFWNLLRYVAANKGAWKVLLFPALSDRFLKSGVADGHYFHVDLWAAKQVYKLKPDRLIDVGSRVDGFVAHVLTFRDIEVLDIRDLHSDVPGLHFIRADVMATQSLPVNCADCVTSLHALEHFGLGRYGDRVDVDGWKKGLKSLSSMLKEHGTLLLAVPVGLERVEFDAHRIFDPNTVVQYAGELGLQLIEFSFVGDDRKYHSTGGLNDAAQLSYGCGCFLFRKPKWTNVAS